MTAPILLIHHAANRGRVHPPGSLAGLRHCLGCGARAVELDIRPLVDGHFALLHDPYLDTQSDGRGKVADQVADSLTDLCLTWRGQVTDEPVGLLAEAVGLVAEHSAPLELQLDLKVDAPLDPGAVESLLATVEPIHSWVRVTSGADWALRQLQRADPTLALGFDPLYYLDLPPAPHSCCDGPPWRLGAYGYCDDHPLAVTRWGSSAEYLVARVEALHAQVPATLVWYVRAGLLARARDEGLDWVAWLHTQGASVAAWTLDPDDPQSLALAQRLASAGVDRITTNDPPALASALHAPSIY